MTAARAPFRFETAAILTRLTDRRARTLGELRDGLTVATTSMIFHHTHTALLERAFAPGPPQNDFVFWVGRTLRQRALAERLAAVDPYAFTDLQEFRKRLLAVVDEHLGGGGEDAAAPPDQEFHFLESVNVASPTPFVANDLGEFREDLARIGIRSVYHHFLTARPADWTSHERFLGLARGRARRGVPRALLRADRPGGRHARGDAHPHGPARGRDAGDAESKPGAPPQPDRRLRSRGAHGGSAHRREAKAEAG